MACGTISEIFDMIAPALASNPRKNDFICLATSRTSISCYGDNYNLAVALLSAHMLYLSSQGGTAAPVSSKRIGDQAISYSVSASSTLVEDLSSTSYGRQLSQLKREHCLPITLTGDAFLV